MPCGRSGRSDAISPNLTAIGALWWMTQRTIDQTAPLAVAASVAQLEDERDAVRSLGIA